VPYASWVTVQNSGRIERGIQVLLDDYKYRSNQVRKSIQDRGVPPTGIDAGSGGMFPQSRYLALSPDGTGAEIPKELFIALSDFLETRKCAGEISIEFRNGEIVSVEAVSKRRYR
jgi:hypothetical protein